MRNATQIEKTNTNNSILVIGAKGKTGRRLCDRLAHAEIPFKAASRSSETPFDWNDDATWEPALEGVAAAYITVYPDLSFPGVAEQVEAFAKLAVSKGAKRLVLLSGRGEEGAQDAEERLRKSGAEWTIVRCSVFNQNFSDSFADAIRYGQLSMPVGDIQEPFIDAEDIADVAFAALTEEGHAGQAYELTGPRLLTLPEVARELSVAIGRLVEFTPVSVKDYAKELVQHGFSEEEAPEVSQLIADVMDGRNATLADGVQRALGRAPRDFGEFARSEAVKGTWNLEGDMS